MDIEKYQKLFQQTVYDKFRKFAQWPTFRQVEIEILPTHRDFNLMDIIQSFPGNSYRGVVIGDPTSKAFLSLEQIRQCSDSEEDLQNIAEVIAYCANKYIASREEVVAVTSEEIRQKFNFDELAIRRIGQLIGQVSIISQSSMQTDYSTWQLSIMRGAIYFDGIHSIDEYFDRLEKRNKRAVQIHQIPTSASLSREFSNPAPLIEQIGQTDPADIQTTTAALMQIDNSYYINALNQSKLSFKWAIALGFTGIAFFIVAVIIALIVYGQSTNSSYAGPVITACSGGIVEVIAGIILVIHSRALDQANNCHIRLNRMQRFLVSFNHCENLEGDLKNTTRADLIHKLGE